MLQFESVAPRKYVCGTWCEPWCFVGGVMDGQLILPGCCNRSSEMTDSRLTPAHAEKSSDRMTPCKRHWRCCRNP